MKRIEAANRKKRKEWRRCRKGRKQKEWRGWRKWKEWKEWCLLLLLGALTLLCFSKAVRYTEFLKAEMAKLDFAASGQEGALDYAGAMSARERNQKQDHSLEYVNWTQTEGVRISAAGLGTEEECDALILCGRSDLLFPGYAVLDAESRNGCLLSSALSGELFGGKDTCGLMIETQGRELDIVDVIDSEEMFFVYESGENDLCSFDRAAVSCISGEIGKTEECIQRLFDGWERMEGRVLVWMAQGVCFLVPCILWIFLMCYCADSSRKAGQKKREDRIEKGIWTLLFYVLLAGGILLLIQGVRIPEDMIPTKWSDFNFWTEYGKKLGASFRLLVRSEKRIPDIRMLKEFVNVLWWAAAAVAGEIVFLFRLNLRMVD